MNNKLTLHHLGRRLAYGLKSLGYYPSGTENIQDVTTLNVLNLLDHDSRRQPILRPLSDLTKPITHKGETFVPIEKLNELFGWQEVYLVNYVNSGLGWKIEQSFASTAIPFSNYYGAINKLLEWHFHLDEPEGTWVDVNTVDVSPYQ